MQKKIMIIAGGDWQSPLVKKAKAMGHYVICSNLYEDSPAFPYADACEVANVLDKEKNLEIARKYMPDAVITDQSDIAVPTVAYLNHQLGLRGIGEEKAALFTDKSLQRQFCKEHGFASPDFRVCHQVEEAAEFLQQHKKIIIKPLDSQSSRGVYTVENREELERYFQDTLSYSNREKAILAEEYVDGVEFTVDGIKCEDRYQVLAISEKQHYPENMNVARELFFGNTNTKFDYDQLRQVNTRMVMAMGLPFGVTHAEYKYMNGQYYLIEIAARGGGTKISSDIVPIMSGIDSNEALIRMALGEQVDLPEADRSEIYASLKFLGFRPGRVKKIEGIEKICKMPGVVDLGLNFREGEEIQPMRDDRSRQGYYIAWAKGEQALRELQQKVEENLQITYYQ